MGNTLIWGSAMPILDPCSYSRRIPYSITVTRLVMLSGHGYANFVSVPINQVCNGAWTALHNSLSLLDISCKQPWVISSWRDSHGHLLPRMIHCFNAHGQMPLKQFCIVQWWTWASGGTRVASPASCPWLFLALPQASASKPLSAALPTSPFHSSVLPVLLWEA